MDTRIHRVCSLPLSLSFSISLQEVLSSSSLFSSSPRLIFCFPFYFAQLSSCIDKIATIAFGKLSYLILPEVLDIQSRVWYNRNGIRKKRGCVQDSRYSVIDLPSDVIERVCDRRSLA